MRVASTCAAALLVLVGCKDGDVEETCMDALDASCSPLYAPTFDDVYARTIDKKCTLSCHDSERTEGGLDMSTPELAYEALVDGGLVQPGDPECSTLMLRLEGHGLDVMPPGAKLPDTERCAIQLWIEDGAER